MIHCVLVFEVLGVSEICFSDVSEMCFRYVLVFEFQMFQRFMFTFVGRVIHCVLVFEVVGVSDICLFRCFRDLLLLRSCV